MFCDEICRSFPSFTVVEKKHVVWVHLCLEVTNKDVILIVWLTTLQVFLEGIKAALTTDSSFQDGWYEKTPSKGLRAAARVYSGWGFSQTFYWNEVRILNQLIIEEVR